MEEAVGSKPIEAHHKPSISQDDIPLPDFGDGVLGNLVRCQSDPCVDELVYLVDDACFRFFLRQGRWRFGDDIPQSLAQLIYLEIGRRGVLVVTFYWRFCLVCTAGILGLTMEGPKKERLSRASKFRRVRGEGERGGEKASTTRAVWFREEPHTREVTHIRAAPRRDATTIRPGGTPRSERFTYLLRTPAVIKTYLVGIPHAH